MRNGNSNIPDATPRGVDLVQVSSALEKFQEDLKSGKIKMGKITMSIYGTQQLTDVLVFLAKLASTIKYAVDDDGKITLGDASKFVSILFPMIDAITGITEVPAEFSDLDQEERDALVAAVKQNLELAENDELAVEAALKTVFELMNFLTIVGVVSPAEPEA